MRLIEKLVVVFPVYGTEHPLNMCPILTNEQIQGFDRKTQLAQFAVAFIVLTEIFTILRRVYINNCNTRKVWHLKQNVFIVYFSQSY